MIDTRLSTAIYAYLFSILARNTIEIVPLVAIATA